jgi:hypothetical protein
MEGGSMQLQARTPGKEELGWEFVDWGPPPIIVPPRGQSQESGWVA